MMIFLSIVSGGLKVTKMLLLAERQKTSRVVLRPRLVMMEVNVRQ